MEDFREYKLMNAALMRKYPNVLGRVYVKVTDTLTGGKQIQGITTDKQVITIEMDSVLSQPLQGWIELLGYPAGGNSFKCNEIICFEQNENAEPFDETSHNATCTLMDLVKESDLYKFNN